MTDGETTKAHTVTAISITSVDPATDLVRGAADPFTKVDYVGNGDPSGGISTVVANRRGVWSADLRGAYDIMTGSRVGAMQIDPDGDFTVFGWVVPATLDALLDQMVTDGRLPNQRVANTIMTLAERAPLRALTLYLRALILTGRITQQTMQQILIMVSG